MVLRPNANVDGVTIHPIAKISTYNWATGIRRAYRQCVVECVPANINDKSIISNNNKNVNQNAESFTFKWPAFAYTFPQLLNVQMNDFSSMARFSSPRVSLFDALGRLNMVCS